MYYVCFFWIDKATVVGYEDNLVMVNGELDRVFKTQVDEIHHHVLASLSFDDLFILSVAVFIDLGSGGVDLVVRQARCTFLIWKTRWLNTPLLI